MMRTRHVSGVTALAVLAACPLLHAQNGADESPRGASYVNGVPVVPVDQSLRSPVRESFSRDVLNQTARETLNYWRQQITSGVRPPMVKETDAEVLQYVAETEGAIGYVSVGANVAGSDVKVLTVAAASSP
jgi:ABC-type phosphate transport system substrate-binding protein